MSAPVRIIGGVITKLVEGEALSAEESKLFGEALLQRTSGRRWDTIAALAKRNALIFKTVQHFKPNVTRAEQAHWLHDQLFQYQTRGSWKLDRDLGQCPSRHAAKLTEWLWQISKLECPLPCVRALTYILRDAAALKPPAG